MSETLRYLAVTPTRNEGPFILEWVVWYKMLGFDDLLILSNDCTDRSPDMLDLLADEGWIAHQPHQPTAGKAPFVSAFAAAQAHPLVAKAEWMFLCDIDEFLIFHDGDGTVQGFTGTETPDAAGIAIHWKTFGTSGQSTWQDGLTHRTFTQSAEESSQANTFFKSLIHQPRRFGRLQAHAPRKFGGEWGEPPNVWIDSSGRVMKEHDPNSRPLRSTESRQVTHANAQLNHYIIRSEENFEFKRGRLSASSLRDRYTNRFLNKFNRNEEQNQSALKYAEQFDDLYAEVLAIPGLMRLHHLCCADYVAAMCNKRGDDPNLDKRYRLHLQLAEEEAAMF